ISGSTTRKICCMRATPFPIAAGACRKRRSRPAAARQLSEAVPRQRGSARTPLPPATGAPERASDLRQLGQGPGDRYLRQLLILQLPRQIRVLGGQVEVAVPAEDKEDGPLPTHFLCQETLVEVLQPG